MHWTTRFDTTVFAFLKPHMVFRDAEPRLATKHARAPKREVAVELVSTSFSSRKLHASIDIGAPVDIVWDALTDYDNLGTFIPSLVENKCLKRRPQGCVLYQVGAQDVAMGMKFCAACTLEIQEYPAGIPDSLCTTDGGLDRFFPAPLGSSSTADRDGRSFIKDISFSLLEGDFQAFKGIWRLQPGPAGDLSTQLQYSLFVKPHAWLPVGLIQSRISSEVVNNLRAVQLHAEHVHRQHRRQTGSDTSSSGGSSGSTTLSSAGTDDAEEL
eukprot:gene4544-4796_t